MLRSLLVIADGFEKVGQSGMRFDQARLEFDGLPVGGNCLVVEPLSAQRQRQVAVSGGIVPQRRRQPQAVDGLRRPATLDERATEGMMGRSIIADRAWSLAKRRR